MALFNPCVPAMLPIQQLRTNDLLCINGVAQCGAFAVNLETRNKEIAFHFNPRFNERRVVRNTQSACGWGCDEHDGGFPFHECQPFEIVIIVRETHYQVTVNGAHFIDYRHRIPKEAICELIVKGDVQLQVVRYQPANPSHCVPTPCEPQAPVIIPIHGNVPSYGEAVISPPIPYTGPIAGGFTPHRMFRIIGSPKGNRFSINLQTGAHCGADVALRFDVRFTYGCDHNVVARSSLINGCWGSEERDGPCFPFCQNAQFEILILTDACTFTVIVNTHNRYEYKHRIPLAMVNHLNITGDVEIHLIQ